MKRNRAVLLGFVDEMAGEFASEMAPSRRHEPSVPGATAGGTGIRLRSVVSRCRTRKSTLTTTSRGAGFGAPPRRTRDIAGMTLGSDVPCWFGVERSYSRSVRARLRENFGEALFVLRARRVLRWRRRWTLRENLGEAFVGTLTAGRRGLRWHRRWSLHERRIRWNRVQSCTAGPDHRPGVPRHTLRLVLEHDDGLLEVMTRGPWARSPSPGSKKKSAPAHTWPTDNSASNCGATAATHHAAIIDTNRGRPLREFATVSVEECLWAMP